MTPGFFNTTRLTGDELKVRRDHAYKQENIILDYFKEHPEEEFTPFDISRNVVGIEVTPITSIRRAITNLTNRGLLIKTDTRRKGIYGHLNYCWQYKGGL